MARARKCDACGCLYEQYDGNVVFKNRDKKGMANAIILIDRDDENKYWSRGVVDLCQSCMSRILDDLCLEEK